MKRCGSSISFILQKAVDVGTGRVFVSNELKLYFQFACELGKPAIVCCARARARGVHG